MKTKLIKRAPNLVAILAFLALLAGNAFAIENSTRVVSPYWQSDESSYTFIAVTHTSLSGMASQIGLTINAIDNAKAAFGPAVTFTIQSGTTTRVFVARTGHTIINPTAQPDAKLIQGTTDFKHGHIRVDPVATLPNSAVTGNNFGKFSRCTDTANCQLLINNTHLHGGGFRDTTMLSFWGAIVMESNTTGFAMEFIGDMGDSQTPSLAVDARIPPQGPNAP
ncbi:MAG: hypothetical protein VX579_03430 [Nitrospinota bacterium]|nr:hypothetical protein [Nitrospinota bacterium]